MTTPPAPRPPEQAAPDDLPTEEPLASVGVVRRHGTQAQLSRLPRVILVSTLALLLAVGTFVATVYQGFSARLAANSSDISDLLGGTRPSPHGGPDEQRDPSDSWEGEALNILVLGSDSRDGANTEFGDFEGMRSDTALIVHIAADRSRVEVVSIPRDLIVEIPQCALPSGGHAGRYPLGTNEFNGTRFNTAFALGSQGHDIRYGAACAIMTVETMTNLYIDDWTVVDMDGFRTMVDAMGGVEMCIEEAIDNRWADLKLEAGCQTLNGKEALGFARVRKGMGDGSDIGRIARQQELMGAMASQTLSAGVLANPGRLVPLLEAAADALHTSQRLGNLGNLTGLAYSLRNLSSAEIHFITPPLAYSGNVVLQTWEMNEIWDKLRDDVPVVDEIENVDDSDPAAGSDDAP